MKDFNILYEPHFFYLIFCRFGEITSFLQVYGVSEFFTTLGVQDQKHTPYITIKTNTTNTDNSQFYDYMQNRKSAIVNAFSSKSIATTPEPENYTESFNYANMDLCRSMSGSAHGDNRKDSGNTGIESKDCFKYTVNSISPMEIATNIMGDYKNVQVSQSHMSSRHPRGSSSKLYNVLGNTMLLLCYGLYTTCRPYFQYINLFHDKHPYLE
jgi:hypothetical protein